MKSGIFPDTPTKTDTKTRHQEKKRCALPCKKEEAENFETGKSSIDGFVANVVGGVVDAGIGTITVSTVVVVDVVVGETADFWLTVVVVTDSFKLTSLPLFKIFEVATALALFILIIPETQDFVELLFE